MSHRSTENSYCGCRHPDTAEHMKIINSQTILRAPRAGATFTTSSKNSLDSICLLSDAVQGMMKVLCKGQLLVVKPAWWTSDLLLPGANVYTHIHTHTQRKGCLWAPIESGGVPQLKWWTSEPSKTTAVTRRVATHRLLNSGVGYRCIHEMRELPLCVMELKKYETLCVVILHCFVL